METFEDPVGDGTRVRQITPFLVVSMLALLLGALPPYGPDAAAHWLGALGCFAAVAALMISVRWYRLPVTASLVPIAIYSTGVNLLRANATMAGGEFGPLLIVPVVWTALYTSRSRMYLAIGSAAAALVLPILLVGAPAFPPAQWRYVVLFTAMAATVGVVVERLTSARTRLVEQVQDMARTDPLTALTNRRGWDEVIAHEAARTIRTGQPLTVALLDLDHFKHYNDAHGHLAGDRLLKACAGAWVSRLRRTDLLARWGGEEFAVLLPDTDIDQAVVVVEELLAVVPEGITCSAGLASTTSDEFDDLIDAADQQLYRSKTTGRSRVSWKGGVAVTAPRSA